MKAVAQRRIRGLGPFEDVRDPSEIGLPCVSVEGGGDEKGARRRGQLFVGEFQGEAPGAAQIVSVPESTQGVGKIVHVGVKSKHGCLLCICIKQDEIIVNGARLRGWRKKASGEKFVTK